MSGHTRLIDEKIILKTKRINSFNTLNEIESCKNIHETVNDALIEASAENEVIISSSANQINSLYPSYLRFHSLIPDDQKVTAVIGNNYVFRNIDRYSTTKYVALDPGLYNVKLYDSDSKNLLCEQKLKAFNCAINTLVVTKLNDDYNILGLRGTTADSYKDASYIRFMQTLPSAPAMDIYIDGIAVIWGIAPNETSELICLPPGEHNIQITAAATSYAFADNSFNLTPESVNDMFIASDNVGLCKLCHLANKNVCL